MTEGIIGILRGNRDYRLVWISNVLSGFGDFIFETTLLVWIATDLAAGRSWSASVTSILLACSALPGFVVGPLAGVWVDRSDPRRMRLRMTWISAVLVGALTCTAIPGVDLPLSVHLSIMLAIVILAACAAQFLSPAASVMSRALLTDAQIPVASASMQAVQNFHVLIAPALAAILFAAFGPFVGLTLNVAAFIVAGLLVLRVQHQQAWSQQRPGGGNGPSFLEDFREGLSIFRGMPIVRLIVGSIAVVMIAGGVANALGIYFIVEQLGATTAQFGWLSSAQAVGMIAGSLIAMRLLQRAAPLRIFGFGLCAFGAVLILYSRAGNLVVLAAITIVLGLVISISIAPVAPLIMTSVPNHVVGRVMSLIGPIFNGSMLIGVTLGGATYSLTRGTFDVDAGMFRFRPIDTIYLVSALLVLATGVIAIVRIRQHSGESGPAMPHISPRTTP